MDGSPRISTLHPEGKQGVRIERSKYELMRSSIISTLKKEGEVRWKDLLIIVKRDLDGRFEGSIPWYFTTVKQDLHARGILIVVEKNGHQYLSLSPEMTE